MRIITVNLDVHTINKLKGLVGEETLYPSRSELIRVAVREFIIKEIRLAKNIPKAVIFQPSKKEMDTKTVEVPLGKGETTTYRIIDREEKMRQFKAQKGIQSK